MDLNNTYEKITSLNILTVLIMLIFATLALEK